jgi:hypothetical protein
VRRADAPPAGWYPDPTSRTGLRWWDGLDWTDHRRPRPTSFMDEAMDQVTAAAERAAGAATDGPLKSEVRRAAPPAPRSGPDRTEVMAEVRAVAREEVDRAVDRLSDQARNLTGRVEPLLAQYGDRAMRWIRNLGIIAIALVVLWMVLQTFAQTSLMGWLGERVDNLVGGWALTPPGGAAAPW